MEVVNALGRRKSAVARIFETWPCTSLQAFCNT